LLDRVSGGLADRRSLCPLPAVPDETGGVSTRRLLRGLSPSRNGYAFLSVQAVQFVLVIEDVVTSGGQVVASSTDLCRLGAVVNTALCVIDRQAGGESALAAEGITLRSLFTKADLDRA
jgi:hypothetical protein